MKEQHLFADVDLPFHVWVRERAGARGFRWVLRDASHLDRGGPARGRGGAAEPDGAPRPEGPRR